MALTFYDGFDQYGLSGHEVAKALEKVGQAASVAAQQLAPAFQKLGQSLQEANEMALKIKSKPATATVSKQVSDKKTVISEDTAQEEVETPASPSPTEQQCEVGVEMSYTHNLGNYQSARVQVSLKVPCVHAEIDEVYDYAKGWVETRLEGLVEELNAD